MSSMKRRRSERRGVAMDVIARQPVGRARGRHWPRSGPTVGALALVAALIVVALTGAWLTALTVAAPIALLGALWAFFMLRAAQRGALGR